MQVVGNSRARLSRRLLLSVITLALAALAALGGDPKAGSWVRLAEAQRGQRVVVSIKIDPVIRVEPGSKSPLPIQVGPKHAIAKNSFIRIRGLPAFAALSDGHAIAPGAWAVPLVALPGLRMILPIGVQGPSEVAISLISVEGTVLAEAKTVLVIAPVVAAPGRQKAPVRDGLPAAAAPKLSPAERERALSLHASGEAQLQRGNISAARMFFERAAETGLAQSAMALAGTYDPDELAKLKVVGLQPDPETARKWYEKARDLGAVEAGERLRRLGAR